MRIEYRKEWSESLKRDMEWKEYGEGEHTILAIPSQDGRFFDWENYQMVDTLSPWIDSGKIRLVCCDTIDKETWSNLSGDNRWRIEQHERWYTYIIDELVAHCRRWEGETMIVTGCSLGAFHAANFFFRRPDLFDSLIAMSGLYHSRYGFPDYNDDLTYANSPQDFIKGMPDNHPWIDIYRRRRIIICIGQGRWEEETLESTRQLDTILAEKHVPAWFDYWGYDVDHDWPSWRNELAYFMNNIMPL